MSGWQYKPNVGDTVRINTIGYVVNSKPECLTLTSSIGGGGSLDPVSIPWKAVTSFEILEGIVQ